MDLLKGPVAKGLGEIDAADLRADDGRQLVHCYRLVRRRFISVVLVARSVVATQDAHGRSPSANRSAPSLAVTAAPRYGASPSNRRSANIVPSMSIQACRFVTTGKKILCFAIQRITACLEVHQVGATTDLHIAADGDALKSPNSQAASVSVHMLSHSPRMIATGARTRDGS